MKRKRTPRYRRVNRYFKSSKQYWKERARRKHAFALLCAGCTHQQIAEQLEVSTKTVSRDLKRTRRYHTGQHNRMIRQIEAERGAEYTKRYENMSPAEQRRQLKADFQFLAKLLVTRKRLQRTLTFAIDVDEFLRCVEDGQQHGRPFIRASPNRLHCRLHDLRLTFAFRFGGRVYPYSTLTFGE